MWNDLVWKIKNFFRKSTPYLIVGLVAFGGYQAVRKGLVRRYMPTSVRSVLVKVPYFGSRFSHYVGPSTYSEKAIAYSKKSKKYKKSKKRRRR